MNVERPERAQQRQRADSKAREQRRGAGQNAESGWGRGRRSSFKDQTVQNVQSLCSVQDVRKVRLVRFQRSLVPRIVSVGKTLNSTQSRVTDSPPKAFLRFVHFGRPERCSPCRIGSRLDDRAPSPRRMAARARVQSRNCGVERRQLVDVVPDRFEHCCTTSLDNPL